MRKIFQTELLNACVTCSLYFQPHQSIWIETQTAFTSSANLDTLFY